MKGRYTPNSSRATGMGGWLRSDPGLRAAIRAVAEKGETHARSIAPVDSGEYVASFTVEPYQTRDGRIAYQIVNTAAHAAAVEFGRHHTLAKTAGYLEGGGS